MKLEIEKMLVLSTNHIPEKDINNLVNEEKQDYPYSRFSTGYGVMIALVSDMELPERDNSIDFIKGGKNPAWCKCFSKEFIEILRIAKEKGCMWINFDRDGTEIEGLPTFDW